MTFAEMYGEVNTNLGSNALLTASSSTKSKEFVNRAYDELVLQYRFHETEATDTSKTTTASVASVTVPTGARRIWSIRDTTNKRLLSKRDIEWYESMDQSTDVASYPEFWIRYGSSILLWPTPDGAYSLQIRYTKLQTDLSADGDTPTIPVEWHGVLVLLASSKAAFWLGMDTKGMNFKSEALGLISALSEDSVEDDMNAIGQISIQRTRLESLDTTWPQYP